MSITGIQEVDFLINIGLSLIAGVLIGADRELKGKASGIGTHCFVIGGSMIFTYLSALVDPNSTTRIAAQIVTGIGFLGAGIILKDEIFDKKDTVDSSHTKVLNLTTAASIWFSGAIGMAIGFNFYFVAIVSIAFAVGVPHIPKIRRQN
ncbi:MgtC/SapB family protein [Candidatus Nitrosocosmicus sp. R]